MIDGPYQVLLLGDEAILQTEEHNKVTNFFEKT